MQRLSPAPKAQVRPAPFVDRQFAIAPAEVIVFTGGENMVLEQRQGELEARLTQHGEKLAPKFRHMSWEGDTVFRQNRMMEWGSWRENLVGAGATMVFTWFGQVEALDATRTPADFQAAYAALLQDFAAVTPRLVVIGPAPFEKPTDPRIPDNTGLNSRLAEFNEAARSLAQARGLIFVDLFTALKDAPSHSPATGCISPRRAPKSSARLSPKPWAALLKLLLRYGQPSSKRTAYGSIPGAA